MRRLLLFPALAAAALAVACPSFDPDGVYACSTDADCRTDVGESCSDGACVVLCGNLECDVDECAACPADCTSADCGEAPCNGDGVCDPDENCFSCSGDCIVASCGRCGDEGTCEPSECSSGCAECDLNPVCVPGPCDPGGQPASFETNCTDGVDEDCDGTADCGDADGDCSADAACASGVEICDNFTDDDGDGLIDCADDDCAGEACPDICGDSICVPATECAACEDCAGNEACGQLTEDCSNLVDDDEDGLTDCEDPGCAASCATETLCDDSGDDDGDRYIDCADLDCWGADVCTALDAEDCGNGHDDDVLNPNGSPEVDCADQSCAVAVVGCGFSCAGTPVTTALPSDFAPTEPILRVPAMGAPAALTVGCRDTSADMTHVLSFIAPTEGRYRFHTTGSSSGSVLVVTTAADCPSATDCDASPDGSTVAEVVVDLQASDTVLILLAPASPTDLGQLWLWVEPPG